MTALQSRGDRIAQAADALGTSLSAAQVDGLSKYLDLLQRWNRTYNLTSIRDEEQMLVLHLFDCLAVIRPLSGQLPAAGHARLLDVGSGGGLPGVVIALCKPNVDVTCVDTVGKKAAFVTQVAGDLRLKNLHAVHSRVESMHGAAFDRVTSRAFATLELFVNLTQPMLAENGVWMAMKGHVPDEEITQLPASIDVFHVEQLSVPELNADRCLVWMKRRSLSSVPTP